MHFDEATIGEFFVNLVKPPNVNIRAEQLIEEGIKFILLFNEKMKKRSSAGK